MESYRNYLHDFGVYAHSQRYVCMLACSCYSVAIHKPFYMPRGRRGLVCNKYVLITRGGVQEPQSHPIFDSCLDP